MAKDNRINFRSSETLAAILSEYLSTESTSSVINKQLIMFDHIMCSSIPPLLNNEWLAIFDALNGVWVNNVEEYVNAESLTFRVRDFNSYSENLGEKWSIDFDALCEKLSGLSPAESCSVYFVTDKFWKTALLKVDDWAEILDKINSLRTRFKPEQLEP